MSNKKWAIGGEARRFIYSVIQFCEMEKSQGIQIPITNPTARVCAMFQLCKATVCKIRKEGNEAESNGQQIATPIKTVTPHNKIVIDSMDKEIIRREFLKYYQVYKEIPSLKKLHNFCKAEIQFQGCKETLWKIILSLGFKFQKCKNTRSILVEKPDIVTKRARYLRLMRNNERGEKRPVVYVDETWIHTHYTVNKCWQSEYVPGVYTNSSAGQRLIVVHAGGEMGFIHGAFLMYDAKSKSCDYHNEMNFENFSRWLSSQLIPGLPIGSIVVLDNAPYHNKLDNKPPSSSSSVSELKLWLSNNNIPFDADFRRSELLHLVATNKPQPIYSTDTILRENGFIPVRLPPYHPDLNPIELIWNMVKRKVSEKNMSRVPLSELKQNTRDAFSTITKDDWIGAIQHVNQISDDYWTRDGLLEEELDRIIINVGIDSTDESSDDEIQRESATDSSATETADTSATESGDEVTTFMNMGVERL